VIPRRTTASTTQLSAVHKKNQITVMLESPQMLEPTRR
jgi:hypothetical protein